MAPRILVKTQRGGAATKSNHPLPPPPFGDCVVMGANAVIPSEAGIQVFENVEVYNILDARLREHDELGHSHLRGRGRVGGMLLAYKNLRD